VGILRAAEEALASNLADLTSTVQADLFESELASAGELLHKGHRRAAGAVAGVVLERHLQSVASFHGVSVRKKNPTLSDLNDPLKAVGIYGVEVWRDIQRLADLRNLCVHQKDREPSEADVDDLI
jgi:hypothetical protein